MKVFGAKAIAGFSIAALAVTCGVFGFHQVTHDPFAKAGVIQSDRGLVSTFSYMDGNFTLHRSRQDAPNAPQEVTTIHYITDGYFFDMDADTLVKTINPSAYADQSGLEQTLTLNNGFARVQSRRPFLMKDWSVENVAMCKSEDSCTSSTTLQMGDVRVTLGSRDLDADERQALAGITEALYAEYDAALDLPVERSETILLQMAETYKNANMSALAEKHFDGLLQKNLRAIDGSKGVYMVQTGILGAESGWRYETSGNDAAGKVSITFDRDKGLVQMQEHPAGKISVEIASDDDQSVTHQRVLADGSIAELVAARKNGQKKITHILRISRFLPDSNDLKCAYEWAMPDYGLPPAIFNSFIRTVRTNAAAIETGAAKGPSSGMKIIAPPVKPKSGPEMIFVDGLKAGC